MEISFPLYLVSFFRNSFSETYFYLESQCPFTYFRSYNNPFYTKYGFGNELLKIKYLLRGLFLIDICLNFTLNFKTLTIFPSNSTLGVLGFWALPIPQTSAAMFHPYQREPCFDIECICDCRITNREIVPTYLHTLLLQM